MGREVQKRELAEVLGEELEAVVCSVLPERAMQPARSRTTEGMPFCNRQAAAAKPDGPAPMMIGPCTWTHSASIPIIPRLDDDDALFLECSVFLNALLCFLLKYHAVWRGGVEVVEGWRVGEEEERGGPLQELCNTFSAVICLGVCGRRRELLKMMIVGESAQKQNEKREHRAAPSSPAISRVLACNGGLEGSSHFPRPQSRLGHEVASPIREENFILSFNSVSRFPLDYIEFNVQVTKDRYPIIFHDNFIITRHNVINHKMAQSLLRRSKDRNLIEWNVEANDALCTVQETFVTIFHRDLPQALQDGYTTREMALAVVLSGKSMAASVVILGRSPFLSHIISYLLILLLKPTKSNIRMHKMGSLELLSYQHGWFHLEKLNTIRMTPRESTTTTAILSNSSRASGKMEWV
uniref:glycerophosphodiester phosphodiesterase n=1 Tax=Kalanchoe fedtschenkoi TaxID=63787 RepID=A0A7N0T2V6_KALFE